MDCPPIPKFCLDFLLKSKTYLKERPPSTSVVNRDFPPSSKPEHVIFHILKGANYAATQGYTLV